MHLEYDVLSTEFEIILDARLSRLTALLIPNVRCTFIYLSTHFKLMLLLIFPFVFPFLFFCNFIDLLVHSFLCPSLVSQFVERQKPCPWLCNPRKPNSGIALDVNLARLKEHSRVLAYIEHGTLRNYERRSLCFSDYLILCLVVIESVPEHGPIGVARWCP